MYPYQTKNRHHTGTVTNESKVVNTTHFVAKASSFLYLEAITAVTLAAGIAAKTTDTPEPVVLLGAIPVMCVQECFPITSFGYAAKSQ